MTVAVNQAKKKEVLDGVRSLERDIRDLGAMEKVVAHDVAIAKQRMDEKIATVRNAARLVDDLLKVAAGSKPSKALLNSGLLEQVGETSTSTTKASVKKATKSKSTKKPANSNAKRAKTKAAKPAKSRAKAKKTANA